MFHFLSKYQTSPLEKQDKDIRNYVSKRKRKLQAKYFEADQKALKSNIDQEFGVFKRRKEINRRERKKINRKFPTGKKQVQLEVLPNSNDSILEDRYCL